MRFPDKGQTRQSSQGPQLRQSPELDLPSSKIYSVLSATRTFWHHTTIVILVWGDNSASAKWHILVFSSEAYTGLGAIRELRGKDFASPLPINIYPRRSSRKPPSRRRTQLLLLLSDRPRAISAPRGSKRAASAAEARATAPTRAIASSGFGILYLWLEAMRAPCRWMIAFVWLCTFIYERHRVSTCDLRKGFLTLRAAWKA